MAETSVEMAFYACPLPDFYTTLDPCWRDWYRWAEALPPPLPPHIQSHLAELAAATETRRLEEQQRCLDSHYASAAEPQSGVRIAVATQLRAGIKSSNNAAGLKARVSVPFAPPSGGCPPIPFHLVHRVARMGINDYLENTVAEFSGALPDSSAFDGVGPFAGRKVVSLAGLTLTAAAFLHGEARIQSERIFDHWVDFDPIVPPAPESVGARAEPYDPARLRIETTATGGAWHVFVETGFAGFAPAVDEYWLAVDGSAVSGGGYGGSSAFGLPNPSLALDGSEATLYRRVVVQEYTRPPTPVTVEYGGDIVENATSQIAPLISTPYVPGSLGIARIQESVELLTVGATCAGLRLVGVQGIAGVGAVVEVRLLNPFPFEATVAALVGLPHANPGTVRVVRQVAGGSESAEIAFLLPFLSLPGSVDLSYGTVRSLAVFRAAAVESGLIGEGITATFPALQGMAVNQAGSQAELSSFYDTGGVLYVAAGTANRPLSERIASYTVSEASGGNFQNFRAEGTVTGERRTKTTFTLTYSSSGSPANFTESITVRYTDENGHPAEFTGTRTTVETLESVNGAPKSTVTYISALRRPSCEAP